MKNLPHPADSLASKKGESRRAPDVANDTLPECCQRDRMEEHHEIRHCLQPCSSPHTGTGPLNAGGEVDGAKVNPSEGRDHRGPRALEERLQALHLRRRSCNGAIELDRVFQQNGSPASPFGCPAQCRRLGLQGEGDSAFGGNGLICVPCSVPTSGRDLQILPASIVLFLSFSPSSDPGS